MSLVEPNLQASEKESSDAAIRDAYVKAVSHDLRTPLSAIQGLANTLEAHWVKLAPERRQDALRKIGVSAVKLNRMLSQLLDLERSSLGFMEVNRFPTDVLRLARRVVEETDLGARLVTFEGDGLVAQVDPELVERILGDLLLNTARCTQDSTPMWVRVVRKDDAVMIVVDDAGPGIPENLRASVFEPFRRLQGDGKALEAGMGLGLVSRFAKMHGGVAWVVDRPGGGASYRVLLPEGPVPTTDSAEFLAYRSGGRSRKTRS